MICYNCNGDEFVWHIDEFGDRIGCCIICGTEQMDDEEDEDEDAEE